MPKTNCNRQRWRCSLCLSDGGTRTNARLSSTPAPTSHSVVREIFKPRFAPPAPGVALSDHLPKTNSNTHFKPEPARLTTSATDSVKLFKLKKASASSQPPEPKLLERTEIPNTPSQGSSQFENHMPKESFEHLRDNHVPQQTHHMQDDGDALALDATTYVQKPTPANTLCSTCQKQDVLAKPGEKGIHCSSCRTRPHVARTGRLEIPETPSGDSSHNTPPLPTSSASLVANCSVPRLDDHEPVVVSSTQDVPMSEAKPDSVTSQLSWFDLERTKISPEIRKVRDDELSCISTANIQAKDAATILHETSLGQSTSIEVDPVADITEQKAVLKARQVLQETPTCDNASVPQVDTQHKRCVQSVKNPSPGEPWKASEPRRTHVVSPSKLDTPGESEPPKLVVAVPEPVESSTYILSKQASAERTTDRAVLTSSAEEQTPKVSESKGTAEGIRSPLDLNVSMCPILASTGSPEPIKRLNNRDLARIALVCAKGTRLTAMQVIDWLASRFSYLQKGQGAWEKSLKSVLSGLPEIHGVKAPHESRIVYSFASPALRAKYEQRYQSYLPPVSVPIPVPQGGGQKAGKSARQRHGADVIRQHDGGQSEPSTQIERSVTKAIRSVRSRTVTPHDSLPPPTVFEQTFSQPVPTPVTELAKIDTSAAIPDGETIPSTPSGPSVSGPSLQHVKSNKVKITSEDDAMFNPFERNSAPRPNITLSDDTEIKCETSLRSVYPRTEAPTVETMSLEEKTAKIAEIRTRPKRKEFFGSAYRLAHVRRYERQDVHNESDGAWKLDSTTRPMLRHDPAIKDCDENRSLLDVFNLPNNAIPMNDGKELAFRDGTLVSDPISGLPRYDTVS